MARRRELLGWAARNDAAIVEDDYDSEFRHVDRPLEPIHRLDDSGRVIYVGSFCGRMILVWSVRADLDLDASP